MSARAVVPLLGIGSMLFVGAVVACGNAVVAGPAAGPVTTAPVACVEVPSPPAEPLASAAPAPTSSAVPPAAPSETAEPEPEPAASDEVNASAAGLPPPPSLPGPCAPACTSNTICWVYEHRAPRPPATAAAIADGGWLADLLAEEDAGVFRRELHCLPESATCPTGTREMSSVMQSRNGVMTRWNRCTLFDGP